VISVIIPAYNAQDTLAACLAALRSQTVGADSYEIIVVDDGSTDRTAEIARSHGVCLLQQPNAGPAAARNRGAQAARGHILLFTDADCEPSPDWIERLVDPFRDPIVIGVKGVYRTRQRALVARFVQLEYESKYARMARQAQIDFIDTYAAAYRREVFLDNGGFDPAFRTASVEDQEFSFRLARQGHRLAFAPRAIVYHHHDVTVTEYWRRKFGIGYWKALLLRRHPERAVTDSHTPQTLKAQIVLLGILCLLFPLALWLSWARWSMLALLGLFVLTAFSLLLRVARRDPPVLLVAPCLLAVRSLALGTGLILGTLRFLNRSPARASPAIGTRASCPPSKAALCAVLAGLVSLSVYLLTLAPGLTWAFDSADGAELATCAYTLGIAHPPGYPTYVLLAHPLTRLPIGEVATRTNIFSALCAAGTVAVVAWTLAQMGAVWAAAIGAALLLAFSPLLWSQAIVTEVHALNALFFALTLSFAATVRSDRLWTARRVGLLAVVLGAVWGLSLGNHPTALLGAPLVLLILVRLCRWRLAALGFVLGLCVYLYLPLRAAARPPVNWADPQTPERLWWLVSGRLYRPLVFSLPLAHLGTRLLAWSALLTRQFLGLGLLVVGLSTAVLWSADRALLAASGATVALCSLFAIGYNAADSYLYLIPALVCVGLWLGVGIDWAIAVAKARWPWTAWVSLALVFVLPLLALTTRFSTMDLSGDRAAYEFAARVLEPAPPDAVLLSRQDAHTFSLWYFQRALVRRPDVLVVDLDLLGYDWYTAQLLRHLTPEQVRWLDGSADLSRLAQAIGRPVCRADVEGSDWTCRQ
jgi:GT2 family glycosyltransferase